MLSRDCKNELLSFLKEHPDKLKVVVMPDFFQDRLISLDCDAERFCFQVASIAKRKGGSIDGIGQTDVSGGNAVNTTSALAALGANVTPVVCANEFGREQIEFQLKHYRIDTSHIKLVIRASKTTALELKTDSGKANVMLRDLGSLADFGPSDLTDDDYKLIENADYICLFNWAGTRKYGTRLAETVFCRAKTQGKGKTYYDTADPTPNEEKVPDLMKHVLTTSQVDILSLNENEAVFYAKLLSNRIIEQKGRMRFEELALESARFLAKKIPARIDLHTTAFSATFNKKEEVVVPAFEIKPLRATGAGDAWNAGNIVGDNNALSDEGRLALANAVSACYLSDPEGRHPTRQKLTRFIKNLPEKAQV